MNKTNFHLLITLNICLPCIVENLEAFWFINTVDGSKTRYAPSSLHRDPCSKMLFECFYLN